MQGTRPGPEQEQPIDFDVLDHLLSFHIRAVNHALSRDLDRRLAGLPVARGTGKVSCLLLIDRNPGIRASTIARATLRDPAATARMIDAFVEQQLVVRSPSPNEGRANDLRLTARGKRLAKKVRHLIQDQSDSFFCDLSAAERDVLTGLLRRTYRRITGFNAPVVLAASASA